VGGARAASGPAQDLASRCHGPRCLEVHHPLGAPRVPLLGRARRAGGNWEAPDSPGPGETGGRTAPALLLARMSTPSTRRRMTRQPCMNNHPQDLLLKHRSRGGCPRAGHMQRKSGSIELPAPPGPRAGAVSMHQKTPPVDPLGARGPGFRRHRPVVGGVSKRLLPAVRRVCGPPF
jgi:hypothetical protein